MPKKIFLVLFIVLSIFAITNSLNAQWVQINNGLPSNVGITALATYGTNIFAGTLNNGVFLSTNGGTSWSPVNNGLANLQVQTLAVAGNYIYAGTNGNGVYRSSDLGSSWQLVNTGLTNLTITYLYVSGNYIFAGTYGGGIFRLPINGLTWTQVNNGLTTQYINAFAYNGQYLFAGGTGLFGSTNNGSSWTSLGNFNNIWIHTIAVLGTDVFVGTENHGVYRSTDNGNTWTQINNGLPNWIVQSLYVVGTSIFAGTNGGVYLSTDNGDSWSYADLNKIAFSFVTLGADIYAGTGFPTGVYKRSLSQMMQVVNVTITSDNAYVFGFGDINGITNYYYPGVCNYLAHEIYSPNTGTETYTIAGSLSGKYIYIAAWSDELTYQGTIAQFSDGNTTILTSPTLPNPYVHWEVYATGINLNPQSNDPEPIAPAYIPRRNSNCPTLSEINTQIAIANQNAGNPANTSVGWVGTTPIPGRVGVLAFGPNNVANNYGFPPQTVSGINPNAQWMWYNPDPTQITQPFVTDNFPNFPASLSREYYIFRVGPLDSLFIDTCIAPPPCDTIGEIRLDSACCQFTIPIILAQGPGIGGVTSIQWSLSGGTMESISPLTGCSYTLTQTNPTTGTITFTQACTVSPLNLGMEVNPTTATGEVTLYLIINHKGQVCYDTVKLRCSRAPITKCDSLAVAPFSYGNLQLSGRTFTIFNQKQPASPIKRVEISFNPPPCVSSSAPQGDWNGGGLVVDGGNRTWGVANSGTPKYSLIDMTCVPPPSLAPQGYRANNFVKFNLGVDTTCGWTGNVILTVIHCDGDTCILTYNNWCAKPPKQCLTIDVGSGFNPIPVTLRQIRAIEVAIDTNLVPGTQELHACTASIVPTTNGWEVLGVSIEDELTKEERESGKYLPWEGEVKLTKSDAARTGLIELQACGRPTKPIKGPWLIRAFLGSREPMSDTPTVNITFYDANANPIALGEAKASILVSSVPVDIISPNNNGDGIIGIVPNPATDNVRIDYILTNGGDVVLEIWDNLGQLLFATNKTHAERGFQSALISTSELPAGSYFVRLRTAKGISVAPLRIIR
jgi:photosystem II stability/assembly factor-like uncharacterized protein